MYKWQKEAQIEMSVERDVCCLRLYHAAVSEGANLCLAAQNQAVWIERANNRGDSGFRVKHSRVESGYM